MSLRFVIGGSGSGKSRILQEELIGRAMNEPKRQFMVIVPDQFTMQTQKEMVERHPRKGIMNIDVQSFGRLCHRIADEVGETERIVLDDTGKNLLLRRLAGQLSDSLPVIGGSLSRSGYIHEIKSVISEFMQYGLGPAEVGKLADFASDKKQLSAKLRDLGTVYEAFRAYLGEHFITKEEKLDVLARDIARSRLLKGSVVALDGFTGFTPVQNKVISQLLRVCEEVIVTIIMPPEELESYRGDCEDHRLFSLSMRTMCAMEQLAQDVGVKRGKDILLEGEPFRFRKSPALAFLDKKIFRGRDEVYTELAEEEIGIFAASTPEEELGEIFRRIRRLSREKGLAYRDIAVISGDLERYAPYAEEVSAAYGIPCFVDNNRKLDHNPFTEFLRSALECVEHNFAYENIMHYLKSGFGPLLPEETDELDNYLLAGAYRGASVWKKAFTRRPAYLRGDENALQRLNGYRARVWDSLETLREIEAEAAAEEYANALYQFILENDCYKKLQQYVQDFHACGDQVREKEYDQVYTQICRLLEQIAAMLKGERLQRKEFIEILLAGIEEIKLGVLPMDVDRVVIGDMERTRLKPVKVLFFAGLNDGVIPASGGGGGLISDIDREFLVDSGFALAPTPRQQMFIQRLYLYHALGRPSEQLLLSYSRTNRKGEAIRPSYLIARVRELFPGLSVHAIEKDTGELPQKGEMAALLEEYAQGALPEEEKKRFFTCYQIFREKEEAEALRLTQAAFVRYVPERLSEAAARADYGDELRGSVSRMESFATCAYAHYLSYGLRLRERETERIEAPDMGSIYHSVLERFGQLLEEKKKPWTDITQEELREWLPGLMEAAAAEYGSEKIYQNARTAYRFRRMERILRRSILTVAFQLKKGSFVPVRYEQSFRRKTKLELPGGTALMDLNGKIDRLDILQEKGKTYLKVTDYKSGKKKLDIRELYFGRQLQLPVYLQEAVAKWQEGHPEEQALAAAMFYYILKDPLIAQKNVDPEVLIKALHKELRLTGLISSRPEVVHGLDGSGMAESEAVHLKTNKDGSFSKTSEVIEASDMDALMRYAEWKLKSLGEEILSGNIARNPMDEDSCAFCDHREECPFDLRIPGCNYRGSSVDAQEAWERIRKGNGEESG